MRVHQAPAALHCTGLACRVVDAIGIGTRGCCGKTRRLAVSGQARVVVGSCSRTGGIRWPCQCGSPVHGAVCAMAWPARAVGVTLWTKVSFSFFSLCCAACLTSYPFLPLSVCASIASSLLLTGLVH